MPDREAPQREKNWYKVTTIILSVAMVAIMFVSVIYYRNIDLRQKAEEKIEEKIDAIQARKAELLAVPKVKVFLLTLDKSGLPETAFKPLSKIPSVVRIEHAGGDTAKSITVEISSASDIVGFIPNSSVEDFTYRVSNNKKGLRIEVPQLRRDSVVEGTIMCLTIAALSSKVRIDTGMLLHLPANTDQAKYFTIDEVAKLDIRSIKSPAEANAFVERLRFLLRIQRDRPTTFTENPLTSILLILVLFWIFGTGIFVVPIYFKGKKNHALGNKIGCCMQHDSIKSGMSESEVRELLGPPHSISRITKQGDSILKWAYEPSPSLFHSRDPNGPTGANRWEPDLFIEWEKGQVIQYEYHTFGSRDFT